MAELVKLKKMEEQKPFFPFEKEHPLAKKMEEDNNNFLKGSSQTSYASKKDDSKSSRRIFLEKFVPSDFHVKEELSEKSAYELAKDAAHDSELDFTIDHYMFQKSSSKKEKTQKDEAKKEKG